MSVIGRFLISLVALLTLYTIIAYAIDPRGSFGTGIAPTLIFDARKEKLVLYPRYNQSTPVNGLILGSSRSMTFRPDELASAPDESLFNFAVENARAEDHLAIYRWV